MKVSDFFPTNYVPNVVTCKLWGLVGSPTELILGLAKFKKFDEQPGWRCWVFSACEYRQAMVEQTDVDPALIALVPQWPIKEVGDVDFAVFKPSLSKRCPIVVVECDGHAFHQLTPEQASNDCRRGRNLQYWRIPPLRFTGTDIVRRSDQCAQEVVDFFTERVDRNSGAQ